MIQFIYLFTVEDYCSSLYKYIFIFHYFYYYYTFIYILLQKTYDKHDTAMNIEQTRNIKIKSVKHFLRLCSKNIQISKKLFRII